MATEKLITKKKKLKTKFCENGNKKKINRGFFSTRDTQTHTTPVSRAMRPSANVALFSVSCCWIIRKKAANIC